MHVAKLLVKKVNANFRIHDFMTVKINKGPHNNFSRNNNETSQLSEHYMSFLEALHVFLCMSCLYPIQSILKKTRGMELFSLSHFLHAFQKNMCLLSFVNLSNLFVQLSLPLEIMVNIYVLQLLILQFMTS